MRHIILKTIILFSFFVFFISCQEEYMPIKISVSAIGNKSTINEGEYLQFKVEDENGRDLTDKATINIGGNIIKSSDFLFEKQGTYGVTATFRNQMSSILVINVVKKPIEGLQTLTLKADNTEITKGDTVNFKAIGDLGLETEKDVTNLVTFMANNKVIEPSYLFNTIGTYKIKATDGVIYTDELIINVSAKPITSLYIVPSEESTVLEYQYFDLKVYDQDDNDVTNLVDIFSIDEWEYEESVYLPYAFYMTGKYLIYAVYTKPDGSGVINSDYLKMTANKRYVSDLEGDYGIITDIVINDDVELHKDYGIDNTNTAWATYTLTLGSKNINDKTIIYKFRIKQNTGNSTQINNITGNYRTGIINGMSYFSLKDGNAENYIAKFVDVDNSIDSVGGETFDIISLDETSQTMEFSYATSIGENIYGALSGSYYTNYKGNITYTETNRGNSQQIQ